MSPRALASIAIPALILVPLTCSSRHAQAAIDPSPACEVPFLLESADTLGAVGVQSSIALDAEGRPRVAYRNASGSQVLYAHKEGTGWLTERVPQLGFYHGVSLALDAAGNAYLGYAAQEETPRGVVTSAKLARRTSGGWTIETIETAFATEVAVGFDPDGVLHAVYFSFIPAFVVRYATRTAEGWTTETALSTSGLGASRFSLAFDPQGHPHITAQLNLTIIHAVRTATGWATDKQPAGEGVSLAVDAQGVPHTASHVRTPPAVQYRTREGGVWHVEAVDSVDGGPQRDVALAIDRYGRPVLAYFDAVRRQLKLAWKDGGVWRAQVVDDAGGGEGPSLFLEDGANPRISYLDGARFDLRYGSGALAPPNQAPAANAGGPYVGTLGEQMAFDATRSADPDGQPLAYAWDFGDGIQGVGIHPEHAYAAAGSYNVCLRVTDEGCPALTREACVTAAVREALDARIFQHKTNDRIELNDNADRHCFQLEPVDADFRLIDLSLPTMVARFDVTRVPPVTAKSILARDTDHNGIEDIQLCFSGAALRTLFEAAPFGKSQVVLALEGALNSGARVHGEGTFEIKKRRECEGDCAVVSPNPLNPDATLTFATSRPGSVDVELFDVQGRRFRTLLSHSFLGAGSHELRIEGSGSGQPLSSGIYFYRIRTSDETYTGRFSVLK